MALVLPMSLLRQSQGQPELGVAQLGRWKTRVTMHCEVGSTSGGKFVSDVLQDIKDRVQIDRRCKIIMEICVLTGKPAFLLFSPRGRREWGARVRF